MTFRKQRCGKIQKWWNESRKEATLFLILREGVVFGEEGCQRTSGNLTWSARDKMWWRKATFVNAQNVIKARRKQFLVLAELEWSVLSAATTQTSVIQQSFCFWPTKHKMKELKQYCATEFILQVSLHLRNAHACVYTCVCTRTHHISNRKWSLATEIFFCVTHETINKSENICDIRPAGVALGDLKMMNLFLCNINKTPSAKVNKHNSYRSICML